MYAECLAREDSLWYVSRALSEGRLILFVLLILVCGARNFQMIRWKIFLLLYGIRVSDKQYSGTEDRDTGAIHCFLKIYILNKNHYGTDILCWSIVFWAEHEHNSKYFHCNSAPSIKLLFSDLIFIYINLVMRQY